MKIPAILLNKDYLKKIAKEKLAKALMMIEESVDMADISERTAFELRVAARCAKEDLNGQANNIHTRKQNRS
jgi:hypothetical protein